MKFSSLSMRCIMSISCMLLCSAIARPQFVISGSITDSSNNAPLAGATVFLSNATKGTTTSTEGKFVLSNVRPGQYELVISMVGYEAYVSSILINANKENIRVQLPRKIVSLRPYIVLPDQVRQRYYEMFKKVFIGRLENAALCKILNPEILFFEYDKNKNSLSASTDDFLVIENKALGYRIKFLLRIFTTNNPFPGPSLTYYEGQALFEELDGSTARKRRWQRNRTDAYSGSAMHFFRAAVANRLLEEGFIMHDLARIPNKDRPSNDSIKNTLTRLRRAIPSTDKVQDSIGIWQRKYDMPVTMQVLSRDTVPLRSVIKRTDQPGLYALGFKNFLYLSYVKKKHYARDGFLLEKGIDGVPFSVLNLQTEYAFFDTNGNVIDPQSLIYEGYWADSGGIAYLLPTDFEVSAK